MTYLVYRLRKVRKTIDPSANISAVINWPPKPGEKRIPARGYILKRKDGDVLSIYRGLEKAAEHFIEIVQKMPKKIAYLITFISTNIKENEKDLFCYPFMYSTSDPSITKAEPFIVKNGVRITWQMFEGGPSSYSC